MFSQDKLDDFGDVVMLLNGVFNLRPNCASNGGIFVVAFGVILRVLISSATSEASLCGTFLLSIFIIDNRDLSVLINRSTIPDRPVVVYWCRY